MNAAVIPDSVAWPLIAFMIAVVMARYLVFNTSRYETYLNHCLALVVLATLLRDDAVERSLADHGIVTVVTAQQLSLVAPIFAGAEFMGFITLWSRQSVTETVRRHRYHRLAAAALSAGFLISGSPARATGKTLEEYGGWTSIAAWVFHGILLIVLSAQLWRMCVKEMRRPGGTRHERQMAIGGMVLALTIGPSCINAVVLAVLEELHWAHTVELRLQLYRVTYIVESFGAVLLGFVPLVLALYSLAGLNATTRKWERLQGLRSAMTTAVPDIAFEIKVRNPGRRKSKLELHHTIVQIRDAILSLRPYFHSLNEPEADHFFNRHRVPETQREYALQALRIAHAVQRKRAGADPEPVDAATIPDSRSTTLEEESAELINLVRWWPCAQADVSTAPTQTPQRTDHRA